MLIALGLALVAAEFLLVLALRPKPPIGPAARIKPGMALADVEARFGRAADLDAPAGEGKRTRRWMTRDGPAPVQFGEDERVTERGVLKGQPPSWFEGLRGRLGW